MAKWRSGYVWHSREVYPEYRGTAVEIKTAGQGVVIVRFHDGREDRVNRASIRSGEPMSPLELYLEHNRKQIGEWLRQVREERGIERDQAGEAIGKSYTVVASIERGRRALTADEFRALCACYGVVFDDVEGISIPVGALNEVKGEG